MVKETKLNWRYTDWSPQVPEYSTMARRIRDLETALLDQEALKNEIRELKGQLKSSRDLHAVSRRELEDLRKQHEALKKTPTDAMLQRAMVHLYEQEQKRLVETIPRVKCPRTGKWIPKI